MSDMKLTALLALALTACTSASHLPPPHEVPGAIIGTTIGNARYEARRSKVSAHIAANLDGLTGEIARGAGPALDETFRLARVPESARPALLTSLRSDPHLYIAPPDAERIENLTIAFMVHGD